MIVALTGGIGAGKTFVLKMFESLGAVTYISDLEAKRLMTSSASLKNEIKALLGEDCYIGNVLNTKYIGQIVFGDPQKLKALNALVHPVVAAHFENFVKTHQTAPYILYESAILFEQSKQDRFDVTLLVTAPEELRIQRIIKRAEMTEADARSRIQNQWPDEKKIPLADYIIDNRSSDETHAKVKALHEVFVTLNKDR